ncbi:MAG: hypothetical protein R3F49_24045 [Planctomycetota bacterium]
MRLRSVLLCTGSLLLGAVVGGLFVNTAGYDELQGVVHTEVREMRRRALAGDAAAARAFEGLRDYIHGEPGPETVNFRKGLHIYDEGFWAR